MCDAARKASSDEVDKILPQKVANSNKVSEVTGRFSQMNIISGAQQKRQPQQLGKPPPPSSMKAGGWHSQTDYLGRSYEIPSARRYSWKVLG